MMPGGTEFQMYVWRPVPSCYKKRICDVIIERKITLSTRRQYGANNIKIKNIVVKY